MSQQQGWDMLVTSDPAIIKLQQSYVQSRAELTLSNSESVRSSAFSFSKVLWLLTLKQFKTEYFNS